MSETYTIEELTALSDADLNKLAAELRGWKLREPSDPASGSFLNWVDSDGVEQYSRRGWTPATDGNQSRELLGWAAASFDGAITKKPILFDIAFGRFDREKRQPGIEAYQPEFAERGYDRRMDWTGSTEWIVRVPGNTARSETIAFCAAMLAMKGALK